MGQAMKKENFVFNITRIYDVTRERMWKAWTDPAQFKQWFGPKGAEILSAQIDLRPGGASKYGMEFNGSKMYGQWAFQEIEAPEKMVAIVSFLDEKGNIIAHPMAPNWPLKILSVVTFTEVGGKTRIDVAWSAYEASDVELQTFKEGAPGMNQGWGGTFERLEDYLAKEKG